MKLLLLLVIISVFLVNTNAAKAMSKTVNLSVDIESEESILENNQTDNTEEGKISYEAEVPELVSSQFKSRIQAKNPTKEDYELTAWSYVYRSSKCYSDGGEREANKITVNFMQYSNVTFDLANTLPEDIEPGDYKLKIKIQRSDRKTADEITRNITVYIESGNETLIKDKTDGEDSRNISQDDSQSKNKGKSESKSSAKQDEAQLIKSKPKNTSFTGTDNPDEDDALYLSKNAKTMRSIPYFLIGFFMILVVYLVVKKV